MGRPTATETGTMTSAFGDDLDSAMGVAVHTTRELGSAYTTLETKFNLVRAIPDPLRGAHRPPRRARRDLRGVPAPRIGRRAAGARHLDLHGDVGGLIRPAPGYG